MSNEEYIDAIRNASSVTDRSNLMYELYEQNRPLIERTIRPFTGVEDEADLMQEAFLALCAACDGYDCSRGVKFIAYALKVIRYRIQNYTAESSYLLRLSPVRRNQVVKLKKIEDQYFAKNGREPSEAYLLVMLGIKIDELRDLRTLSQNIVSLDQPVKTGGDSDEVITIGETVESPENIENEVIGEISTEHEKAVLWGAVDALPADEMAVIKMKYKDRITTKDIAERENKTELEIGKLHQSGLKRLRRSRAIKAEFLPDSRFYCGGLTRFKTTWTSVTERLVIENLE